MQSRLLNVAKELDVTIEDGGAGGAGSAPAVPATDPASAPRTSKSRAPAVATEAPSRARTDAAAVAEGDDLADLVDPRYEDLWVSADAATAEPETETGGKTESETGARTADAEARTADAEIDLPDLAAMELDFDSDDD